jgi:hypothetical protein
LSKAVADAVRHSPLRSKGCSELTMQLLRTTGGRSATAIPRAARV